MDGRSIFTVISFCVFALTLGELTSTGSQRIKVCRDVCAKTNGCVPFQEGIVTFACHRPTLHHGDNGERSRHTMETNKRMKCTKPCISLMENSKVMGQVHMGTMTDDALDTVHRNQISRQNNSLSHTGAETQDAKETETAEGVRNETEPYSPLSKVMDTDTELEETVRTNINATTRVSATDSGVKKDSKNKLLATGNGSMYESIPDTSTIEDVFTQDLESKGAEKGRILYSKSNSVSHRRRQNQDSKSKGTDNIRINETTLGALNPDSKVQEKGRNDYRKSSSQKSNSVFNQDQKSEGTGTRMVNGNTPSSVTGNSVSNQDPKSKTTGTRIIYDSTPSSATGNSVSNQDPKSKTTDTRIIYDSTSSSATGNSVSNQDPKSKTTDTRIIYDSTPSSATGNSVSNQDPKSKTTGTKIIYDSTPSSATGKSVSNLDPKSKTTGTRIIYDSTPSSVTGKSVSNQDPKSKTTGTRKIHDSTPSSVTGNSVSNQDPKSKTTGTRIIYDSTSSSATGNSVSNQDPKSKTTDTRIIYDSTPSSATGNSVSNLAPKSEETGEGRLDEPDTNQSQGISLQTEDSTGNETSHPRMNTSVREKQSSNLDVNTTNTRKQPVKPKSQPTVNLQQKGVNGKKTGDGDVSQAERNVSASEQGYEKLTVGTATFSVKKYAVKKTWEEALEQCRSDGGTLVNIRNRLMNRLLTKKYAFFKSHWIGLNDLYDNNSFFWTDGSPLTFGKWQNEQPSHTDPEGKKENCVDLSVNFFKGQGWNDQPCDRLYQFICEI